MAILDQQEGEKKRETYGATRGFLFFQKQSVPSLKNISFPPSRLPVDSL
jgi:hypothetical protein